MDVAPLLTVAPWPPASAGRPMSDAKLGGVPARILLIDDDARLHELLASYLDQNGFHVTWAADGKKGLVALEAGAFDAVLLDVMMPGMDGLEVVRRIRQKSGIPVVMLTAKGD